MGPTGSTCFKHVKMHLVSSLYNGSPTIRIELVLFKDTTGLSVWNGSEVVIHHNMILGTHRSSMEIEDTGNSGRVGRGTTKIHPLSCAWIPFGKLMSVLEFWIKDILGIQSDPNTLCCVGARGVQLILSKSAKSKLIVVS